MTTTSRGTAIVTGASAGIGAATAVRLAREGFDVVIGARRRDALKRVADEAGATALELDVTDPASVESFAAQIDEASVLVNNAGLARGRERIEELPDDHAREMWETNVMGLLRITRVLLPKIEGSGNGHIVNVSSTAGIEAYEGGAGYTSTKHAVRAISKTLRLELVGKPIRITDVAPGLVETDFSLVRFDGDAEAARKVYEGIETLVADDIADCIAWAVTRPPHVNIDEIVVRPRAQATSTVVARGR